MTVDRTFDRRALLASGAGLAALAASGPALAARVPELEAYVETNARQALAALSDRSLSPAGRQQAFGALMQRFANVPSVASFVLGRYARAMRADAELWRRWLTVFTEYSMAVYEDQLDQYRGNAIRVTGSTERTAGRDVIVRTEIAGAANGRPLPVQWRMLRSSDGVWRVVDVSLILDGNEIWLAQQQQRDFLAELDRSRGDLPGLIRTVEQTTATLRARIAARAR